MTKTKPTQLKPKPKVNKRTTTDPKPSVMKITHDVVISFD